MDEAWERAVEAALEGQDAIDSASSPKTLTLDGAVKCLHGRLPPPGLLERFQSLEHLSIASVGVSSLESFPKLRNLQRLILSDNRIAGGLEFLVEAGLDSLRDLDLSNNRIQFLEDLAPLAQLRLVSLDLYECPVTRVKDYRSRVFGMIRSLKYLDKMDADENERPETDDEEEEEDEEDEEDDDDEEDPGSGEIDGEDRAGKKINGARGRALAVGGIVAVDEDEESDADEEEMETGGRLKVNGSDRALHHHLSNEFRVAAAGRGQGNGEEEEEDDEDDEYVEDSDDEEGLEEEINVEVGRDEELMVIHEVEDSDEEDIEEEEEDDGDESESDEDEEDEGVGDPGSTGRLTSTEGEIDEHDQGEEDENGEIGEADEKGLEEEQDYEDNDGEDEEDDFQTEYVMQPIAQPENEAAGDCDLDAGIQEDDSEEEVDDDEDQSHGAPSHPSQANKRRRDGKADLDDDSVEDSRPSKHR